MRRLSIITALSLVLLAACSGGASIGTAGGTVGSSSSSSGGSSSSSSGGASVTAASLIAQSSATTIPVDGSDTATITVLARNAANDLISGVAVEFSASTGGGIAVSGTGVTDSSGAATATLSAVDATAGTPITVTATGGGLTATVKVQVVTTQTAATTAVASLNMSTSSAAIFTDGSTTATITALALDAGNNALSGVPVTFKTTSNVAGVAGALVAAGATTGADGTVSAVLSTGGNPAQRIITVTGATAALSTPLQVSVVPPPTPVMGNGTGAGFVPGAIGVGTVPPAQLSAGGTTSLAVTITDDNGTLYNASPVTVGFNSTCLANGQAQILAAGSSTPTQTITTTTGSIGATYVAKGCTGTDTIIATGTAAGQNLTASGSVSIAQAAIGSIQFISATPTTIGLKGTGLNETSTVIFKVTDSTGGAEANVPVTFALDTIVGGLSLSPATAVTASDGTVQTVVSAGTVHTVVLVTASIANPAISTKSSGLSVTTGLPASGSFSIAVAAASNAPSKGLTCPNVEGFDLVGITVPVTVILFDRYGNPVPDGTSIAFQTDGGGITYPGGQKSGQAAGGGSCTTPAATPGDGTCIMTWTSGNPRPGVNPTTTPPTIDLTYGYPAGYSPLLAAGRAIVLASTIGEESFTDLNGTGFYQAGDPFANLGEPYEDDNEQAAYQLGDPFVDFKHTGVYAPPSGSFIGVTCTGTAATDTCTTSTLAIGASHLIVMSTSGAKVATTAAVFNSLVSYSSSFSVGGGGAAGGLSIVDGQSGVISFQVVDQNGNAMPAGTTIGWTFSNPTAGVTVTPIAPGAVPCDGDLGGETFSTNFSTTLNTKGNGELIVTVTAPGGTVTTYAIGVTIT